MDDYKRALLMHTRREIETTEEPCLCSICISFLNQIGLESCLDDNLDLDYIKGMLPEMNALFDYKTWLNDGSGTNYLYDNGTGFWWSYGWNEPRLAMLDFLLNNR